MSKVYTSAPNPQTFQTIEQIVSDRKKLLTQKTFYTQRTQSQVEKSQYEKLQEWMKKVKQDKQTSLINIPETQVAIIQDGIIFDTGNVDSNIKQKLMFNKEKMLKAKFENEIANKDKQKGLKKQAKDAYRMGVRIKVSNVMFYQEEDTLKQKEELDTIIRQTLEDMKVENDIQNFRIKNRDFFRYDRKDPTRILDFLIIIVDNDEEKAKIFISYLEEIIFNRCKLVCEIQPPRFQLICMTIQKYFTINIIIFLIMEDSKLHKLFLKYTHNKEQLNGSSFVKIFKDSKLINSKLKSTDLDIIFSKAKTKGKQKLSFEQFQKAIELAAVQKQIDYQTMLQKIESLDGPHFHGTKAQNVKLHDDKTTYTGVYAKGGPKTNDLDNQHVVNFDHYASREQCEIGGGDMRTVKRKHDESQN